MIGIVDYGIGNVNSIVNMLKKIGIEAMLVSSSEQIAASDKLILPGVGSFDAAIIKLNESGLRESISKHALEHKKPLLGICLGMQMLGFSSEEGSLKGLGYIPFKSVKFSFPQKEYKVPHMGWDFVSMAQKEDPMVKGFTNDFRFYFVHSYYAVCENSENILLTCDYGGDFVAAVHKDNIYGVQFHPEKSHKFGMVLLENFARGANL